MLTRDLIVIGASAGGLRAVRQIAQLLPSTFGACVLVVLHISRASRGMLASVISWRSGLPVKQAEHGDPIRPGQIYIAPADYHMSVGVQGIELDQGPRVNRARPAIDPLFLSAARLYGNRVAGVVLTGFLQDGTAGLVAIKRAGGVSIVQDPLDAEFPHMPQTALQGAPVDYCAPLAEIPLLLNRLALGLSGQLPAAERAALARLETPAWHGLVLILFLAPDWSLDDPLSVVLFDQLQLALVAKN